MVRTPSISISSSEKDKDKATQTLSSAFASMIAVGAPYQTSRNQLKVEDASSASTDTRESGRSRKKSSRFSAFSRSGRSPSPFRFGLSKKRSSSANRLKVNPDDDTGSERSEREKDSDTESVMSSASGITPRNNAFFSPEDEEEIDLSVPSSHGRRRHPASLHGAESQLPTSGSSTSLTSATGVEADVESVADSDSDDDDAPHASSSGNGAGEEEEDDEDPDEMDPEVLDNTLYNAECLTSHQHWNGPKSEDGHPHFDTYEDEDLERDDDHITAPNVVLAEDQVSTFLTRRGSKMLSLTTSRPRYERNRCTITISHGDADAAAKNSKRPKRYVVASDGSEESSYAVEWTIGTVLRDGDEMLVVSVMETDSKLDALDPKHEEVSARMEHQRIRQAMASVLAKQATHLLERTRLEVKISCQAIHAKNPRHMLLDLIDFYEPTMVVVGSRGLGSLRGILLGSTSHYLVQKSSAPVMVARKRLKLPALPRGKGDVVESVRARHMRLDQASIEKLSNAGEEGKEDGEKDGEEKNTTEEETSPDNETGAISTVDSVTTTDTVSEAQTPVTPSPPRTPSPTSKSPINVDGSPKLQRKSSKAGPTAIPHTSLEREAETRVQIQQRKEEAAKLHEGDKKRHLFAHHGDPLKMDKDALLSDSEGESRDEVTRRAGVKGPKEEAGSRPRGDGVKGTP
ncbi:UspA [Kalmanozyma brasiliensis GHG001]|uniref:UspA domain-containing protein n=1 Tax=Kalmanozyma brasiliensis (strain GHG001) TaxID=1365824 RepID=V5GQM5_KALBG|nr:UspA [Kalmanozyma brasiliensis GHG001]EST08247.1 UspA [Kalmanozyma brasiliensis GHG001]